MKPSVFVASSSEQIDIAEAIEVNLESCADITSWKHTFRAGQPYFSELIQLKERFDFAVIVLTPDDVTESRGSHLLSPRDNVIFELGLFLGSIGAERVYAVIQEGSGAKIMSDYYGVSVLTYRGDRADANLTQALRPACVKIKSQILELGRRAPDASQPGFEIDGYKVGLRKIYDNYDIAEQNILSDLRGSSGPIRLFFHIASQNIGLKGSLFDVIHDIVTKSGPEIRILHASADSPLFAPDRLLAIGKNPERVAASLRYVDESLKELQEIAGSSLRGRLHKHPFIWRMYGFSERLYLMPYFSKKDATKSSPVLVFDKKPGSMHETFSAWFDHVWSISAPANIKLSSLITPATPSGTALFLNWNGYNVFGIPRRDIIEKAEFVRFYGVGGKKENITETFEECALREGAEETGMAVEKLVDSDTTDFYRSNGTIERIRISSSNVIPRLIYEKKDHSGMGAMKVSDDYYYMIGYEAVLRKKPVPTRELAAILFLANRHLSAFAERRDITLGDILSEGALIREQKGIVIDRNKILVPHGTAAYLVRKRGV